MIRSNRLFTFLISSYRAMIELIFFSFIWLTIAFYSLDVLASLIWITILIIGYSLYGVIFINKKTSYLKIVLYISAFILFVLLACTMLSDNITWINGLLIVAFSSLFLISGFRQFKLDFFHSFQVILMAICISGHLGLQMLKVVWLTELQSINTSLLVLGIVAIIICLFIVNERMLDSQTYLLGESSVHKQAVQLNRILISFISVITIVIILFRSWQEQIERFIKEVINRFLLLFGNNGEIVEEELEIEQNMFPVAYDDGEVTEKSQFFQFIERILAYLAYALIVVLVIIALFYLSRLLIHVASRLLQFLKKRVAIDENIEVNYIDEVEQLEKLKSKRNSALKVKTKAQNKAWTRMTKQEKCKYLYVMFIKQLEVEGYQYMKPLTVKEQVDYISSKHQLILNEVQTNKLVQIYEQAKYGHLNDLHIDINEQELELLYRLLNLESK